MFIISLIFVFLFCALGCSKKSEVMEENADNIEVQVDEIVEFVVSKNKSPKNARLVVFIITPFTYNTILLQYATFYAIC